MFVVLINVYSVIFLLYPLGIMIRDENSWIFWAISLETFLEWQIN